MKIKDKKCQDCQVPLGQQRRDFSCPFVSGKILHTFPKIHSRTRLQACSQFSTNLQGCALIKSAICIPYSHANMIAIKLRAY